MIDILMPTIAQGLLWAIMALGVYITFRVLDIADLTVEGSFPLGAAVAAAMIMTMSTIITTTVSAAVDMTIITIMQMRSSQAGAVRQLKNSHVRDLRRSLRHFPSLTNMVSFSVQKECFRQRTEHGSILIWFRKKPRSVRAHRNIQAVCA